MINYIINASLEFIDWVIAIIKILFFLLIGIAILSIVIGLIVAFPLPAIAIILLLILFNK